MLKYGHVCREATKPRSLENQFMYLTTSFSVVNFRAITSGKKLGIDGGLKPKDFIIITGQSTSKTKKWTVNLMTAKGHVS